MCALCYKRCDALGADWEPAQPKQAEPVAPKQNRAWDALKDIARGS